MTNACPVVAIPQRPRAPAEIKWEPRASLQKPHPSTKTTLPLPPGSLHPLWLAKGTEGGGRGTAEKTRVCRMAFEHRRSAAPLSETYSGGTAGRYAHVYTATGSDDAVGTGRTRSAGHMLIIPPPPNMNPQWESAAQLCSHLLSAVGTVGGGSSGSRTFD